ncbi:hypothetical protein EDB84DRAFT_1443540 [Lactarius hengduanensis]|nr:hypothetical protein EDB84DRAFT_1443540 [Lactarius hengduanensis]
MGFGPEPHRTAPRVRFGPGCGSEPSQGVRFGVLLHVHPAYCCLAHPFIVVVAIAVLHRLVVVVVTVAIIAVAARSLPSSSLSPHGHRCHCRCCCTVVSVVIAITVAATPSTSTSQHHLAVVVAIIAVAIVTGIAVPVCCRRVVAIALTSPPSPRHCGRCHRRLVIIACGCVVRRRVWRDIGVIGATWGSGFPVDDSGCFARVAGRPSGGGIVVVVEVGVVLLSSLWLRSDVACVRGVASSIEIPPREPLSGGIRVGVPCDEPSSWLGAHADAARSITGRRRRARQCQKKAPGVARWLQPCIWTSQASCSSSNVNILTISPHIYSPPEEARMLPLDVQALPRGLSTATQLQWHHTPRPQPSLTSCPLMLPPESSPHRCEVHTTTLAQPPAIVDITQIICADSQPCDCHLQPQGDIDNDNIGSSSDDDMTVTAMATQRRRGLGGSGDNGDRTVQCGDGDGMATETQWGGSRALVWLAMVLVIFYPTEGWQYIGMGAGRVDVDFQ